MTISRLSQFTYWWLVVACYFLETSMRFQVGLQHIQERYNKDPTLENKSKILNFSI
jgi:hypothetical protein